MTSYIDEGKTRLFMNPFSALNFITTHLHGCFTAAKLRIRSTGYMKGACVLYIMIIRLHMTNQPRPQGI